MVAMTSLASTASHGDLEAGMPPLQRDHSPHDEAIRGEQKESTGAAASVSGPATKNAGTRRPGVLGSILRRCCCPCRRRRSHEAEESAEAGDAASGDGSSDSFVQPRSCWVSCWSGCCSCIPRRASPPAQSPASDRDDDIRPASYRTTAKPPHEVVMEDSASASPRSDASPERGVADAATGISNASAAEAYADGYLNASGTASLQSAREPEPSTTQWLSPTAPSPEAMRVLASLQREAGRHALSYDRESGTRRKLIWSLDLEKEPQPPPLTMPNYSGPKRYAIDAITDDHAEVVEFDKADGRDQQGAPEAAESQQHASKIADSAWPDPVRNIADELCPPILESAAAGWRSGSNEPSLVPQRLQTLFAQTSTTFERSRHMLFEGASSPSKATPGNSTSKTFALDAARQTWRVAEAAQQPIQPRPRPPVLAATHSPTAVAQPSEVPWLLEAKEVLAFAKLANPQRYRASADSVKATSPPSQPLPTAGVAASPSVPHSPSRLARAQAAALARGKAPKPDVPVPLSTDDSLATAGRKAQPSAALWDGYLQAKPFNKSPEASRYSMLPKGRVAADGETPPALPGPPGRSQFFDGSEASESPSKGPPAPEHEPTAFPLPPASKELRSKAGNFKSARPTPAFILHEWWAKAAAKAAGGTFLRSEDDLNRIMYGPPQRIPRGCQGPPRKASRPPPEQPAWDLPVAPEVMAQMILHEVGDFSGGGSAPPFERRRPTIAGDEKDVGITSGQDNPSASAQDNATEKPKTQRRRKRKAASEPQVFTTEDKYTNLGGHFDRVEQWEPTIRPKPKRKGDTIIVEPWQDSGDVYLESALGAMKERLDSARDKSGTFVGAAMISARAQQRT
eukprot:TRINITY_DN90565_c0_g1_i1.p1 TRINITY_DN90565_c0_g1~~TRINITY_DN90565_c0_g1_i1.p1  ORF type:complete len:855 (+),score=185.68 TRINITY_DN90565_c0_g1_i1:52-2616(+)